MVDEFMALSEEHRALDPYLRFSDVPTWMCYAETNPQQHLIRLQDVKSHFASLTFTPVDVGRECMIVRVLDRVGWSLLLCIQLLTYRLQS